jgi:protein-S-isoprenylcysteine O-methyltransferase Ste14
LDIRKFFFKHRGVTPVPLLLAALILADPSWTSFWVGAAITVIGESIRFWGVAYAGATTRTTNVGGSRLVTDGPYARVRNPLYIGNFIVSAGWTVMAWPWMPWMGLIAVSFFALQYACIVNLEEEFLSEKFGVAYEAYRRTVPRWIPRRTPAPSPEKTKPNWRRALQSERNTFQAIAAVAVLILLRWHLLK